MFSGIVFALHAWLINHINGFNIFVTDCPLDVQQSLNKVRNDALCTVSSTCAGITCCVNIPLLNRTFEVGINIDYSYKKMRVHVEKMYRKHYFSGFESGKEYIMSLGGVFKIR